MKYYHVYTKGLEDDVIFQDRQDFIVGMNQVAVAVFKTGVIMLAFVLMSNHFHFVIIANSAEAERFIYLYKRNISRYIRLRYGKSGLLRRISTSCDEIDSADEGLKRCIAYALDNPVKAGLFLIPQGYEWGSASCYFNGVDVLSKCIPVTELSVRRLKNILHSDERLDGSYMLNPEGYIEPRSYVDYRFVENLFGRPKSFEYFLSTSASSRKVKKDVIMFSDSLLREALREMLRNKYGLGSTDDADDEVKMMLAKDLRTCFNAPSNQIARLVGCPLKKVLKAFEG